VDPSQPSRRSEVDDEIVPDRMSSTCLSDPARRLADCLLRVMRRK